MVRGRKGYDETGSRYAEEMQREEQQWIKEDEEREGKERKRDWARFRTYLDNSYTGL
jgi:hypothetical protein